jgi:hypothetical protein
MDDKIAVIIAMTLLGLSAVFGPALPGVVLSPELTNIIVPIITALGGLATGVAIGKSKQKNNNDPK